MEKDLQDMTLTDDLTGIYNRRGFFTLSEQHLKLAKRNKMNILLLYIDLDNLKEINDSLGHQEGDQIILDTANILKSTYRESDIIARIGGDEFVVFPVGMVDENISLIHERLQKNIDTYNEESSRLYNLSLSVGIASYDPQSTHSIDELLAHADKAMYKNKLSKKMS
jgi:diguanylate cyclase (GGDEF)-like protein